MKLVEKLHPSDVPGRCILFPQVISDPDGFVMGEEIDASLSIVRPTISIKGLREASQRYAGMVSQEEVSGLHEEIADLNHRIEQLEGELQEYDRRFQAIDVLESADYTARKKAGRPKKAAA